MSSHGVGFEMVKQATRQKQVFLSHPGTRQTRAWVRDFAHSLERRGARVWLDEAELDPGESLQQEMERAIRQSDLCVFLMSPDSVKRPIVLFEMGIALGGKKSMVAVTTDDLDPAQLPEPFRRRIYLPQGSPDATAEQVLAATSGTES